MMNRKIFIITIIVLIIDQLTKMLASIYLVNNQITIINDFFNLTYALNSGAAWSILNNHQIILTMISIILLIVVFMFKSHFKDNKRNIFAFGLLYGGIAGNLIDRIFHGHVIDFLDFKIFMAIVLGVFLIIIAIIKGEDSENNSKRK